jgi:hypothetical protein
VIDFIDSFVLDPALRGDWDALAQHLERGGRITQRQREFLIAVLRGEVKRPKHRPGRGATVEKGEAIAYFVEDAKRNGTRAGKAVEAAAKHFAVTTRTVQRAVAQNRGWIEHETGPAKARGDN